MRFAAPTGGLALALLLGVEFNDYWLYIGTIAGIWAILAVSFDVLLGFTGYLSLAHGALFGAGAYCSALLTTRWDWSLWAAMPAAGVATACLGVALAATASRSRGLYFAVLTLGIGLIGTQVFLVAEDYTGGISGFVGIPSVPSIAGLRPALGTYGLVISVLWLTWVCALLFLASPLGAACLAVREDLLLAQSLGVRTGVARLGAFAFSAFFAGVAGALFAAQANFIGPESFTVMGSGFQMVVLVVVGGMGTLWGPVLGAILLTAVPELLRVASGYSLLAYGIILLLFILFLPKGIASLFKPVRRARPAVAPITAKALP